MRLREADIQRSKVYVIADGHTHRYDIEVLCRFGEYHLTGLSIVDGNLYLTLTEDLPRQTRTRR